MKRHYAIFSILAVASLLLSSCGSTSNATPSGDTIMYPTVTQMEQIDRQMGMAPRQVRPRESFNDYTAPVSNPTPAPAPTPEAPTLAPAPIQQPSAPPQPSVDAETLQKLR